MLTQFSREQFSDASIAAAFSEKAILYLDEAIKFNSENAVAYFTEPLSITIKTSLPLQRQTSPKLSDSTLIWL